ncbi:hypothetical protein MKX01_035615 [Papaver californicum]|nr:hypothetical protein MKX01_035615 [Papaver californicum]
MAPWYIYEDISPCLHIIVDGAGCGFAIGAVGGGIYYFVKGLYNSPKGERFIGGAQAFRLNSPRLGGYCAVWAATVIACECTSAYVRQKEDPWNFIIGAAATGGLLDIR